jgi:hypothetical protein
MSTGQWFPTSEQFSDLAGRLFEAYRELCKTDECNCITRRSCSSMLSLVK